MLKTELESMVASMQARIIKLVDKEKLLEEKIHFLERMLQTQIQAQHTTVVATEKISENFAHIITDITRRR